MDPCDFDQDRDVYRPVWRLLRRVLTLYSMSVPALPSPDEPADS